MSDSLQALDWDDLVGRLGSAEELASSAREAGALLRKRQVAGAADLLRLCFAYVLVGRFSLRTLAAWAEQRGVASMSDVAMLKRLKASADWVGGLVSELLAERCPEAFAGLCGDLRMMAVDATVVAPPGPKRVYWMVHTVFDLATLKLCSVEVTDRHEAERLSRGAEAGELRIADRAHAKADDLARVVEAGADFLVRAPSNYPRLLDGQGQLLDRLALCREAGKKGVLDLSVSVQDGKSKVEMPARVVILPMPPEAAEKARRAARRLAAKARYKPSLAGIEMAGYLVLLTSLPPDDWPPGRLASTYRLRWQIELAFKRMKSLVGLEDLRAKDPDLARLWINTALLAALLAEDDLPALDPEAPDSLPLAA